MNQSVEKSLVAGGSRKDGRLRWRKGGLPSLALWISAAVYAVIVPNHGLHDRLAGTWVVRR